MAAWTNKGKADLAGGGIAGREFRIVLVTAAPASNAAAADLNFLSEITANEATFTNYARKTLASVAVTEDDTNDRALLTAANPSTYTAAGGATNNTVVGAWIVRRATTGADTPATDVLWMYLAASPQVTTNGGDLSISFGANGLSTVV